MHALKDRRHSLHASFAGFWLGGAEPPIGALFSPLPLIEIGLSLDSQLAMHSVHRLAHDSEHSASGGNSIFFGGAGGWLGGGLGSGARGGGAAWTLDGIGTASAVGAATVPASI